MVAESLNRIAFQYSREEDFHKIEFRWNGKYGQEFKDTNSEFRVQLCEFIFPQIEKVGIDLIRDLYIEFAKSSEASWGVYLKLNVLGQELLNREGTKYLMDYLKGASYSVDAYAASAGINISIDLANQILSYINEELKTCSNEKERRLLEQIGKNRFGFLANVRR